MILQNSIHTQSRIFIGLGSAVPESNGKKSEIESGLVPI
jgi:hypothetical protein